MDLTGKTIGKYNIISLLGQGGMGSVFKAEDSILHREAAIKVLSPAFAADDKFVQRFLLEARSLARLKHPNIVGIYDASWEENQLFIVMEYIKGGSLADLTKEEKPYSPEQVVKLLKQVAKGLDYANQRGLVHRDIKPGNILINTEGEAMLTDFGLVKDENLTLTAASERFGTPLYMAPEQIDGQPVSAQTDIYALGVVAYQLLTGRVPFKGTLSKVFEGHLLRQPPSLVQINPGLSSLVEQVVLRAMEKNPADRYPSATAFADALENALLGGGGQPVRRPPAATRQIPPASGPVRPASQPPRSGPVSRQASGPVSQYPTSQPPQPKKRSFLSGLGLGAMGGVAVVVVALICICGGCTMYVMNNQDAATATPLPPTAISTVAPPDTSDVLYSDDFSDPSSGWSQDRASEAVTDYQDGGYRIFINKPEWYYWATLGHAYTDVIVEVDATKIAGPDDNEFGLICRYQNDDNFYYFTVSSDGFYGVAKVKDGSQNLLGMTTMLESGVIHQGDATNKLRTECIGSTLRFFANETLLFEVEDGDFDSGDVGLLAGTFDQPGTDIMFDNFVVSQP